MNLDLTRDEADRLDADGRVVLFRAGTLGPPVGAMALDPRFTQVEHPPAEFVEAAKPCELCDPRAWVPRKPDLPCGDCLDGKRRIAVKQPQFMRLVTVGHVVVEWGPDLIVKYGEHTTVGSYVVVLVEPSSRKAFRVENHRLPVEQHELTLPPDIDPATLVGQYAIGIRKVET